MSVKKISKDETKEKIKNFFISIKEKTPEQITKIKRVASRKRINLKEEKKLFCKKCFVPFSSPKIRISSEFKVITCKNCGNMKRIKISSKIK